MNIFVLDENPVQAAQYHCDKHVVKMLLETAQILCTVSSSFGEQVPYRPTHKNHPCTLWAARSKANWLWLRSLGIALYDEYKFRYNNRSHKSGEVILALRIPGALPDIGVTPFAQAIPEKYNNIDPVVAYRDYYGNEKRNILSYTKRSPPDWLEVEN